MFLRTIRLQRYTLCHFLWHLLAISPINSGKLPNVKSHVSRPESSPEFSKEPLGGLSFSAASGSAAREGLEQLRNGSQNQLYPVLESSFPLDNVGVTQHTNLQPLLLREQQPSMARPGRSKRRSSGQRSVSISGPDLLTQRGRTSTPGYDQYTVEEKNGLRSRPTDDGLMAKSDESVASINNQQARRPYQAESSSHHLLDSIVDGLPTANSKKRSATMQLPQMGEAHGYVDEDAFLQAYNQNKVLLKYAARFSNRILSLEHDVDSQKYLVNYQNLPIGFFRKPEDKSGFIVRVIDSIRDHEPQSNANLEESYVSLVRWMYFLHEQKMNKLKIPTFAYRIHQEDMLRWLENFIFGSYKLVPLVGETAHALWNEDDVFEDSQIKLIHCFSKGLNSGMFINIKYYATYLLDAFQAEHPKHYEVQATDITDFTMMPMDSDFREDMRYLSNLFKSTTAVDVSWLHKGDEIAAPFTRALGKILLQDVPGASTSNHPKLPITLHYVNEASDNQLIRMLNGDRTAALSRKHVAEKLKKLIKAVNKNYQTTIGVTGSRQQGFGKEKQDLFFWLSGLIFGYEESLPLFGFVKINNDLAPWEDFQRVNDELYQKVQLQLMKFIHGDDTPELSKETVEFVLNTWFRDHDPQRLSVMKIIAPPEIFKEIPISPPHTSENRENIKDSIKSFNLFRSHLHQKMGSENQPITKKESDLQKNKKPRLDIPKLSSKPNPALISPPEIQQKKTHNFFTSSDQTGTSTVSPTQLNLLVRQKGKAALEPKHLPLKLENALQNENEDIFFKPSTQENMVELWVSHPTSTSVLPQSTLIDLENDAHQDVSHYSSNFSSSKKPSTPTFPPNHIRPLIYNKGHPHLSPEINHIQFKDGIKTENSHTGFNPSVLKRKRNEYYIEYQDNLPLCIFGFIQHIHDPPQDGHCGYNAVADQLGYLNHWWVRWACYVELVKHAGFYNKLWAGPRFYSYGYIRKNMLTQDPVVGEKNWLNIAQLGDVLANAFNRPVIGYYKTISMTYLPWRITPEESKPPIFIGWVNRNHYLSLRFQIDSVKNHSRETLLPYPPPTLLWKQQVEDNTVRTRWLKEFQLHFQLWDYLNPPDPSIAGTSNRPIDLASDDDA